MAIFGLEQPVDAAADAIEGLRNGRVVDSPLIP